MPAKQGKQMRLKIVACRQVYNGRNQKGDEYTIYEVEAAKPDGSLVNEKLRAFASLPIGQDVDVTVVPFESEKWGKSYTLYPKGSRSGSATEAVNELRSEVEALREAVSKLNDRVAGLEQLAQQRDAPQPAAQAAGAQFGDNAPW